MRISPRRPKRGDKNEIGNAARSASRKMTLSSIRISTNCFESGHLEVKEQPRAPLLELPLRSVEKMCTLKLNSLFWRQSMEGPRELLCGAM